MPFRLAVIALIGATLLVLILVGVIAHGARPYVAGAVAACAVTFWRGWRGRRNARA